MVRYFVKIERFNKYAKIRDVPSNKPEDIVDVLKSVEGVYRFSFFEKDCIIVNGREVLGEQKNFSDFYYIGKRLTIDEVKEYFPEAEETIKRMEILKGDAVLTPDKHLIAMMRNSKVFTP